MPITFSERDLSLMDVVCETVKEHLADSNAQVMQTLSGFDARLTQLESDVAGLISLLGE